MSDPIAPTFTNVHANVAPGTATTCKYSGNPYVQLLVWKDPVTTGKVVATILSGLIIIKFGNPINWMFHMTYIGLLAAAVADYSGSLLTGQGFISKYFPEPKQSYSSCINKSVLPLIEKSTVLVESRVKSLIYCHSLECNLKAAGISYIIYKLTSWFSIFSLVVSLVVVAFTVPAIYARFNKEIDAAINEHTKLIRSKTVEFTKEAKKAIEPYISTLVEKSGPVGNFIKTQFPTRTAGSTVGDSKATSFNTAADVPTSAKTTGSTQFPNVPTSNLNQHDVDQIVNDLKH